ncbi:T9SS type A sorting domain-containing protein [candidate division KSB1 bacterium]|nr:T9SS type A sorting domain-containing protein [candidate division KSB1 bacterium]
MLEIYLHSLVAATAAGIRQPGSHPRSISLRQNYPNPFNQQTRITYSISENGLVTLKIYDLNGQCVRDLVHHVQPAGEYHLDWDGLNNQQCTVASGIYFGVLKGRHTQKTIKMHCIK